MSNSPGPIKTALARRFSGKDLPIDERNICEYMLVAFRRKSEVIESNPSIPYHHYYAAYDELHLALVRSPSAYPTVLQHSYMYRRQSEEIQSLTTRKLGTAKAIAYFGEEPFWGFDAWAVVCMSSPQRYAGEGDREPEVQYWKQYKDFESASKEAAQFYSPDVGGSDAISWHMHLMRTFRDHLRVRYRFNTAVPYERNGYGDIRVEPIPGTTHVILPYLRKLSQAAILGDIDGLRVVRDDQSAPAAPAAGSAGGGGGGQDWIALYFRGKQFALLKLLHGKHEVTESAIFKELDYKGQSATDSLRRRVSETNKNLCERADLIGGNWNIRERRRDGIKSYFLEKQ